MIGPQLRRRLRRSLQANELRVLALALVVAVAASTAVGLFVDRLRLALEAQTGEALGADGFAQTRYGFEDDYLAAVRATGVRTAAITVVASVVLNGEESTLAAVKALPPAYPLRNRLRIADAPYAEERAVDGGPPPGEAWVDARLWSTLRLDRGDSVEVGALRLPVTAVIAFEPDRGGSFVDLAPRLMIHADTLPGTGLLAPGSRAQFLLHAAGTADQVAAVEGLDAPLGVRWITPEESRPAVRNTLLQAGRFLDLAALVTMILGAAAIALSASLHGRRLQDEVALLRTLGAGAGQIVGSLAAGLLALGLIAGGIGVAVGAGAQQALVWLLAEVLQVALPPAGPGPLLSGLALGLVLVVAFALPPVLAVRNTPPVRVFQRQVGVAGSGWWISLCLVAGIAGLLVWQLDDRRLVLLTAGGSLGVVLVLGTIAGLGVRLLRPLRRAGGTALRYGLGNISRRGFGSVSQAVALGLSLMALLLLAVARNDLLETWRDRLPADTPNQFLLNIQPGQVEALNAFLADAGVEAARLWPMARGRLVGLRGEAVTADSFDDPETQRWINREFNLSWTRTLGPDNELFAGELWAPDASGEPQLSVDRYAVERLDLQLGDTMTLRFADQQRTFTVTSFRDVSWESFQPNFFLVTMPGVLEDGIPATWLTSFYLPAERRAVLRELVREFPNVTALDLDAIMQQVRQTVDRVVRAVEFVLLFAVAAGLTVLLAAIEGSRDSRRREIALLRTLGATRRTVAAGVLTEYAVLGALAGLVGAFGAQAIAWGLAEQVFQLDYGLRPALWISGLLAGAVLVAGLGWLSLRATVSTPPARVLNAAD